MTDPFADTMSTHGMPQREAVLLASLLHLMSHYTARDEKDQPCVRLASVIERHLCALARLPDLDPVLRATCEQLCERWAALVDEGMPRPVKRNFIERIMRTSRARRIAASADREDSTLLRRDDARQPWRIFSHARRVSTSAHPTCAETFARRGTDLHGQRFAAKRLF